MILDHNVAMPRGHQPPQVTEFDEDNEIPKMRSQIKKMMLKLIEVFKHTVKTSTIEKEGKKGKSERRAINDEEIAPS